MIFRIYATLGPVLPVNSAESGTKFFADLSGAIFSHVDFSHACLGRANLSSTCLDHTDLRNADMTHVEFGQRAMLVSHNREVDSVAFSADGKFVVSGSVDRSAKFWSTDVHGRGGAHTVVL